MTRRPKHSPVRGGQVEAWLKLSRDQYDHGPVAWETLDLLLDEYRLRADTGIGMAAPIEEAGQ